MRQLLAITFALGLAGLAAETKAQTYAYEARAYAGGGALTVPMDQGVKILFASAARDVVVGNPAVADVTMLGSSAAVVMGKAYGVTSVSAFDAAGRSVFSRQVIVAPASEGRIAVYRGVQQNNFVCGSSCEALPTAAAASAPVTAPPVP